MSKEYIIKRMSEHPDKVYTFVEMNFLTGGTALQAIQILDGMVKEGLIERTKSPERFDPMYGYKLVGR